MARHDAGAPTIIPVKIAPATSPYQIKFSWQNSKGSAGAHGHQDPGGIPLSNQVLVAMLEREAPMKGDREEQEEEEDGIKVKSRNINTVEKQTDSKLTNQPRSATAPRACRPAAIVAFRNEGAAPGGGV